MPARQSNVRPRRDRSTQVHRPHQQGPAVRRLGRVARPEATLRGPRGARCNERCTRRIRSLPMPGLRLAAPPGWRVVPLAPPTSLPSAHAGQHAPMALAASRRDTYLATRPRALIIASSFRSCATSSPREELPPFRLDGQKWSGSLTDLGQHPLPDGRSFSDHRWLLT